MADKAFVYTVVFILYFVIAPVMASRTVKFINNPGLAGKKCASTELTFTETTNSVLQCTTACKATTGCTSAFYNHVTGTCYGCYGYYDVDTTALDDESGTTYHCPACPFGWTNQGHSCYRLSQDRLTWVDALNSCQTENASLVEINDEEERMFVQVLSTGEVFYWLGLNDIETEDIFRWAGSNASATFTHWEDGEPNGSTGENCVWAYPLPQDPNGGWDDLACTPHLAFYVCEKAAMN